jgi:peptidoglycan/xylan/chitin deacetylase (PgdA/CDA1 family)
MTLATVVDCLMRRQRLGWWTIDCKDTKDGDERRRIEDILGEITTHGGGVVLMHDFDKVSDPADSMSHADYVITLTGRIIKFAEENGYQLMRLGDVLQGASR